MDNSQLIMLILGNWAIVLPLFLWNRSEARTDARHSEERIEAIHGLIRSIQEEMKDFHNRLCDIERERK